MSKAYDELVDFIAAGSTPADLLKFQPSQETRDRVHHLIRKEKESGLLPEEASELDDYMRLEHLMRLAKARARDFAASEPVARIFPLADEHAVAEDDSIFRLHELAEPIGPLTNGEIDALAGR